MLPNALRSFTGVEDQRVDISLWKNLAESLQNFLPAAHPDQPVMNQGDAKIS